MSFEINKLMCAFLSAILIYLLSSFIGDLIYHSEKNKKIKLSYKIEDKEEVLKNDLLDQKEEMTIINATTIKKLLQQASFSEGEKFVKKNCTSCHDFNLPIKNKIGPSLATVLNRKIAFLDSYKYSTALKNKNDKWSLLNLYQFLENPKEWAKGTKMSYKGIRDSTKLINAIKYLEKVSIDNES